MTRSRVLCLSVVLAASLAASGAESTAEESWRVLSHTMAKGIDSSVGRPIGNTTRFVSTDELAVCWFELEVEGFGPFTLNWRWFEPSGAVYRDSSSVELIPRRGTYRFWDLLKIRNTPVEVKLGKWIVDVYVRTEKLFQTSFLVESPATSYSVQVKAEGFDKRFFTSLYVDGVKTGTILGGETKELTFKIGTTHTFSVDKYVQGEVGTRFYCSANSTSASGESFHVFLYETEYYLKVFSEYGAAKGEGWYRAGSVATFSVTTPFSGQWGIQHLLKQWTGNFEGSSATGTILMNGPKEVTALWTTDYTPFYTFVAIVAGAITIVIATILVSWRRRPSELVAREAAKPPTPNCPVCGRQTLYVERVNRYFCTQCKRYV